VEQPAYANSRSAANWQSGPDRPRGASGEVARALGERSRDQANVLSRAVNLRFGQRSQRLQATRRLPRGWQLSASPPPAGVAPAPVARVPRIARPPPNRHAPSASDAAGRRSAAAPRLPACSSFRNAGRTAWYWTGVTSGASPRSYASRAIWVTSTCRNLLGSGCCARFFRDRGSWCVAWRRVGVCVTGQDTYMGRYVSPVTEHLRARRAPPAAGCLRCRPRVEPVSARCLC
jgi:hypothetical protein